MSKQALEYKNKGNAEFKKGNHAKAIEFYTYATEMDPQNPVFYTNRSFAYFKMGAFEKSLRDARKATTKDAKWAKGHYRAGMACMELKAHQEALDFFKAASALDGSNATFASAVASAKAAMMSGMTSSQILKMEGNDFFKSGDIEAAIKSYTNAINAAGSDEKMLKADVLANRAACYRQLYEPDKCIADTTMAIELNPNHVKAYIRRAQSYESVEKYKQSLADFQKAAQLAPNTPVAYQGATRVRRALDQMC